MRSIQLFIVAFGFYFFFDLIWIGIVARRVYKHFLADILRQFEGMFTAHWFSAIGVYVLIAIGIVFLAYPRVENSYLRAFGWGALLGLVIYGTYDLTNYAVLHHWPWNITFIDMAWGTLLCALTTTFVLYIDKNFFA